MTIPVETNRVNYVSIKTNTSPILTSKTITNVVMCLLFVLVFFNITCYQGSQVLKTGKSDIPQTSPPPMSGGQREWGCSINNIIISVFVVNINNCSALQKKIFDT